MLALEHLLRRKRTTVWHIFWCLALVSFLCRSAIPTGYMPDVSSGDTTGLTITLCLPNGGTDVLQIGLSGPLDKPLLEDSFSDQHCPYGALSAQAAAPAHDGTLAAVALAYHSVLLRGHDSQALPPLPALGPPLGSRAPPSFLA